MSRAVCPVSESVMIPATPNRRVDSMAAWAKNSLSVQSLVSGKFKSLTFLRSFSACSAIFDIVWTASSGYFPEAVSPLSMMASVPAKIAVAMSVTSARVGRGFSIMVCNICVATMTGFFFSTHFRMIMLWIPGIFSTGTSIPKSPRAIMMP